VKLEKNPNWRCGAQAGNRDAAKPVTPLSALPARPRCQRTMFDGALTWEK
jgi:hypothetical protein